MGRVVKGTVRFSKPAEKYTGWYLKYTDVNPSGMPAVQPAQRNVNGLWSKYISPVKMTETIQNILWDVLKHYNPSVTVKKYGDFYQYDRWACNNNGFNDPDDPRKNFISGEDLAAEYPKLMDGIIMRGQLYQGNTTWTFVQFLSDSVELAKDLYKNHDVFSVMGVANVVSGAWDSLMADNTLVMLPGVHAMSASSPVSAQVAIDKGWTFRAMSYHQTFAEDFFPSFGGQFWAAHIINETATYPLHQFEWWDRDYPPDPLVIY